MKKRVRERKKGYIKRKKKRDEGTGKKDKKRERNRALETKISK